MTNIVTTRRESSYLHELIVYWRYCFYYDLPYPTPTNSHPFCTGTPNRHVRGGYKAQPRHLKQHTRVVESSRKLEAVEEPESPGHGRVWSAGDPTLSGFVLLPSHYSLPRAWVCRVCLVILEMFGNSYISFLLLDMKGRLFRGLDYVNCTA